jgi:hypothetical protein
MSGSAINMEYCQIRHAYAGVTAESPASFSLDHCLIESAHLAGVFIDGGSATPYVQNTAITNCGQFGILCQHSSLSAWTLGISGNDYGIQYIAEAGQFLDIFWCVISGPGSNSYYGIFAEGYEGERPQVTIQSCYVSGFGQGGIYIDGVTSGSYLYDISVTQTGIYGIYFSDCFASIPIVPSIWQANFMVQNTYGLWIANGGSATVRRTKFLENLSEGVHVADGGWVDLGEDEQGQHGENAFYIGEECLYHVYNENELEVQALYNFWDPRVEDLFNNAKYEPWLNEDPLPNPRREVPDSHPFISNDFELAEAFPNPFNPTATIRFSLASPKEVNVDIYNLLGQKVRCLYSGQAAGGVKSLIWDGENDIGQKVAAGLYLVQLRTAEGRRTIKVTVLK